MQLKALNYTGLFLVLAGMLAGCAKSGGSNTVYMPSAAKVVSANFDITDTVEYTVTLVGADYPTVAASAGNTIQISLKVDSGLVTAFNQENGTSYPLLPTANYTLGTSATISSGQSASSPLQLIIRNGDQLQAFSSYLLPVSIDKVSGGQASNSQRTTYFVVTRSPSLDNLAAFDRSGWTIAGYSTQEPAEGGGNGLAAAAIDGDFDTYWQSKWAGGEPGPPHYITIDMGETKTIHGISIVDRSFDGDWAVNGHGQPKTMTISVSTDGTSWVDDGSFNVPIVEPQNEIRFFLPVFKDARYFKVTVTGVWATSSTNIAEIYAL